METLRMARVREIPPVNEIIHHPKIAKVQATVPAQRITEIVQDILAQLRSKILAAKDEEFLTRPLDMEAVIDDILKTTARTFNKRLKRVINATGIVLHTNCGRSVLPSAVLDFVTDIASGYSNLELELHTGERGSRYSHVEDILCKLTGAEAAMVVNNNAAAVMLIMGTFAAGKEVVVSRGELVEVGGSFRIPEVLKAGGASLVEVGATNKTHLPDYAAAITENTAALLKVHTSNFRVLGFTQEVERQELVQLGREKGVPVIEDLGSGTLVDLSKWGLPYEPTVQETVRAGVDLVTFSGDKLLGGPQAGIIIGKREYIQKLKTNQLTRALRIDKLTLAALEGILRIYLEQREGEIPTLTMLSISEQELKVRADALGTKLGAIQGIKVKVEQGFSQAGGGALPTAQLATYLVCVTVEGKTANQVEEYLRFGTPPVLARIQKDKVLLDVRTLLSGDEEIIVNLFAGLIGQTY